MSGSTKTKNPDGDCVHIPGPADGWVVKARFSPGGSRWKGEGPALTVVGINLKRGSGSQPSQRMKLLRKVIDQHPPDGATVYLTNAGFFGMVAPEGDKIQDLCWRSFTGKTQGRYRNEVGSLARSLPADSLLVIGVDTQGDFKHQKPTGSGSMKPPVIKAESAWPGSSLPSVSGLCLGP